MKKNIGLLFGSFNPIHKGHINIANYFINNSNLEEIWLVISPLNPFKVNNNILNEVDRLKMVNISIEKYKSINSCDIEFSMQKPSYTYLTLKKLRNKYPQNNFTIIIGEDNYLNFDKWKNHTEILEYHNVFVYPRDNNIKINSNNLIHKNISIYNNAPKFNVSSTYVRENILNNDIYNFLDEKVIDYIKDKKLYI